MVRIHKAKAYCINLMVLWLLMDREVDASLKVDPVDINIRKPAAQFMGWFVAIALTLFLAAGTFRWIAGWCFLILYFGFAIIITLWMFRHAPGLLQERVTGLEKLEAWDKLFLRLAIICFIARFVLMPLDAVRFHWSHMPVWLQIVGGLVLTSSSYLFYGRS